MSCPGTVTCMRSLMAFQTLPAAEVLLEDALAFGTAFCPPVPLRPDALCLPCPQTKFVRVLRSLQVACEPGSRSGLAAEGDGWDALSKKHCLACDLCLCISTDKSVTCLAVFFLSVQTSTVSVKEGVLALFVSCV